MMLFHKFTVKTDEDGGKRVFLDGIEIEGVIRYELSEGVEEPSKLTLTLIVEDVDEVI